MKATELTNLQLVVSYQIAQKDYDSVFESLDVIGGNRDVLFSEVCNRTKNLSPLLDFDQRLKHLEEA